MSAIGRISGPLLKSNLTRNGIDLAFETDLLYLDVNNQRIGIKNAAPQYELDITGTTRTTNLIATNRADIGNINVQGNTIWSDNQYLNLGTLDNVVYNNKLRVDDIDIEGNVISTNTSNSNLELRPNGTGTVEVLADMNVTGNIHATGNISADGSITLGDADTDNVTFNAEIASNLIPDQDRTYVLGSAGTQYAAGTDYTVGDATIVISSGTGTLSVPASGVAWIDAVTVETTGYYYLITLEAQIGTRYAATTTANWTGSNPQTVTVNIPGAPDGTYNVIQINKDAKRWNDLWVRSITTDGINAGTIIADGINLTLRQGNIYYVSENGDDANYGDHPQDPFGSLSHALGVAAVDIGNGELAPTIKITPGVYTETFPLTVPAGVTVKGESLRSVKIVPTTATRYNDAFLLNGETTVEDITVADFYSGGAFQATTAAGAGTATLNVGTAPFAHAYVSGGTITFGGSDYAITDAVYTHGTGQLVITHAGPDAGVGTSTFIKNIVFSCNGGNRTFPDNGYALRFATDFEVTSRSPYVKNITVITKGSTTTVEDPRGFNAGDAGKGAYVDGAYATANSKEAAMLFHSVTFITPGVDGLTATNGARIEWLNSFTYFANRGLYAFDSNDGLKGSGKTRIRLSGLAGTAPAAAQTVTFTSTDSSTVVGPLTIESVEGTDILIVNGKNTDLIGFDTTPATIAFSGSGTATTIENVDVRDFGAEIRMIGSASVYGNFGLVGDGPGVLVYAIGHNLAYVGNGKEVTNETSTVIQANEVIEINNAQIRYNSVDHKGDFRVGDLFYVNQDTGSAAFSVSDFIINTTNGVSFNTGSDTTFIDGTKVETGDWRFSGNTIETLSLDANFAAASGEINLLDNTNITGNLDVTGNVTIGGNITIGDEASDTIQFVAGIDSDIIPRLDSTYSLGTATKTWSNLYVNQVNVDDIEIRDNFIQTTASNSNLELRANGTGEVLVPSNNVQIDNDLTVSGTTTLANTSITGIITLVGDFNQTGNYTLTEDLTVGQNLTVGAAAQFEEILIDDNFITTTTSNTDLDLRANGTGTIIIPNNNVNITNDLAVTGDINANNLTVTANVSSTDANIGNIQISGTTVEATASNADLELRANGTGIISVPTNNVNLAQVLTVQGVTNLSNTNITGTITHVGNTTQTGNYTITGQFSNGDIQINSNTIETTTTNSDLELRANGTGTINVPNNDVTFSQALTVSGATDLQNTTVTGTITHVGNTTQTGNLTIGGEISNGNILIEDNFIATTNSNSDLELRANGTGEVLIPSNDVRITNNLFVNGDATLGDTNLTGNVNITGDITQTGDYSITSDLAVGGDLTVTRSAQFEEVLIDDNFITTTTSNADLELRANGTGEIRVPNNDVHIVNDLAVDGTITVGDINSAGTITANRFSTGDILIDDNFITTTLSNSDLELRANGTGEVTVPSNNVTMEQDLTVNGDTDLEDTTVTGTITHVGNTTQTGDFGLTGNLTVSAEVTANGVQLENIQLVGNVLTTTLSNSDLELRANGTGSIVIPNNNVEITGDLTVDGTLTVTDIDSSGTIAANNFRTGDILVDDNFITTTNSNSDLELRAAGTGSIVIDTFGFNNSTISTTGDMTLTPSSESVIIDATGSLKLPAGNTSQRPTGVAGQIRYNSELTRFEGFNGTNWINLKGVEDLDGNTKITAELTEGANDNKIRFYNAGQLTVDIDANRLNAPKVTVDDITIDGNLISTTTADTDLELTANGTGSVKFDNFAFKDNTITNIVADSVTTFESTNNGYVKFDGTYGLIIPAGGNAQRPPIANTELGQLRWNTDAARTEIYDGTNWVSVAGSSAGISRADAENIAFEIVLSLG
jgi:hypothetical protein